MQLAEISDRTNAVGSDNSNRFTMIRSAHDRDIANKTPNGRARNSIVRADQ